MFFYTADFTSLAFSLLNLFHCDWDCLKIFTSKKGGRKCPPHAKLLARGFAVMRWLIFYAAACKSVFYVASQEANEHIFLRGIVVLQGSERWPQFACHVARTQANSIAIRELSVARSNNNNDERVFHVVLQWASNNNYIFYVLLRGGEGRYKKSQPSQGCEGQLQRYGNHATIKYIICCQVQEATTTSIYHVVLLEKQQQLYYWCCKAVVLLEARNYNKLTIARREVATIKHFVCCWSQGWRQWAYLGTVMKLEYFGTYLRYLPTNPT
jgi:hypothetical protein